MATTTSEEFEKATDYAFKEEDIERAKALVGRWAPSGAREFLTTVTPDATAASSAVASAVPPPP